MCEACLPNNVHYPWTPDYIPFIWGPYLSVCLSVCQNIPNFVFVYIDLMIFRNTIFLYVALRPVVVSLTLLRTWFDIVLNTDCLVETKIQAMWFVQVTIQTLTWYLSCILLFHRSSHLEVFNHRERMPYTKRCDVIMSLTRTVSSYS